MTHTFHALDSKSLHLTHKILIVNIHHGAHKLFNALGSKGNATEWKVCRTPCCVKDRLDTGTSPQFIELET
jgi:hypothetical protein